MSKKTRVVKSVTHADGRSYPRQGPGDLSETVKALTSHGYGVGPERVSEILSKLSAEDIEDLMYVCHRTAEPRDRGFIRCLSFIRPGVSGMLESIMITLRKIRRAGLTVVRPTRGFLSDSQGVPHNAYTAEGRPVQRPGEARSIAIDRIPGLPVPDRDGVWGRPSGWRVSAPTEELLDAGLRRLGF